MATNLYKQFGTDKSMEQQGVFLQYGLNENGEPIMIKIARAGGSNIRYLRRLEAATKPYRRAIQTETLDNSVAEQIMREVYADTVILGWSGVQDEDGKPLAFTRENVIKVLTDLPDLFQDIREQAQLARTFREEELEADAGN